MAWRGREGHPFAPGPASDRRVAAVAVAGIRGRRPRPRRRLPRLPPPRGRLVLVILSVEVRRRPCPPRPAVVGRVFPRDVAGDLGAGARDAGCGVACAVRDGPRRCRAGRCPPPVPRCARRRPCVRCPCAAPCLRPDCPDRGDERGGGGRGPGVDFERRRWVPGRVSAGWRRRGGGRRPRGSPTRRRG